MSPRQESELMDDCRIRRYFVSRSLLSELSLRQHLRDLARHTAQVRASRH